ncbi:MAG: translational GTPase TypA [Christensenellaceae bacterium]|nr:translational GTPase TypA [Christensenellaceae bacterium]
MIREDLRNVAIIAHVDHGKTTLVNEMLRQGGVFRENQVIQDRVMDSGDIERERGITILSKNTSITYKGVKINIVDTPGHADFGGEVERVLKMVDGVLLLVDAYEGPMPQTRFVLSKALDLDLKVIVVVNKIDRPDARLDDISDEVLELLFDLEAGEAQLESPVVYCSARAGTASMDPHEPGTDLQPLFDTILDHIDPPDVDVDGPLQVLVSSIEYNDYVGRMSIGKIERGSITNGQQVLLCDYHDPSLQEQKKVSSLYLFSGLKKEAVENAKAGDIVAFAGIEDVNIGNTVCDIDHPEPVPFVKISEPTVEMMFLVNDSPFAGQEGKYVTSRHLRQRLFTEILRDVSLRVEETDSPDRFRVLGRGEMHLSILIENMRREGYEFAVGKPRVLFRTENGVKTEPIERLTVDVPKDNVGIVIEKLGYRKGEMVEMNPLGDTRMRLDFLIPERGLFGYRSEFLTDTRGEGIMNSVLEGYMPYKGDIPDRQTGSLICYETGEAVTYGLYQAQDRGTLFVTPGMAVYGGMVVGINPKQDDIVVNVCKKKHATNIRAAGSDEALRLTPAKIMSLEETIEFIGEDEYMEVTPKNIRIRKKILDHNLRNRYNIQHRNQQ